MPKINIRWLLAKQDSEGVSLKGSVAVMMDILAASTNIAMLVKEARELYVCPGAHAKNVLDLIPGALLVGESRDPELEKLFTVSNCATHVVRACQEGLFREKQVVLTTSNGTRVVSLLHELGAGTVLVGTNANLATLAEYIRRMYPGTPVELVPTGGVEPEFFDQKLGEDLFAAEALRRMLWNLEVDRHNLSRRSAASIEKQYRNFPDDRWPTRAEDLPIVLTPTDTHKVVPECVMEENGLIRVHARYI